MMKTPMRLRMPDGSSEGARGPGRRAGEHGQTLVFSVLMLVVMLAFAAVVVDGGNYLLTRRNMQGTADAAALAAVRELPTSTGLAEAVATDYVENQNSADEGKVKSIEFTDGNTNVTVDVQRTTPGVFLTLFGMDAPTISATATAEVAMMGPASGMLPMAFMRDSYVLGENAEVKFDGNATGNRGPVAPDNDPPNCVVTAGGDDFRELIMTEAYGGMDACAHEIGDTINTETGNIAGPARQGFDERIGANTDSFDDVFEKDPVTGEYLVALPDSPRLGIVPVIENTDGSADWPAGTKPMRIIGYLFVYIGKTDEPPSYPAYTNNGKNVYVTPVQAIMPADFNPAGGLIDFDAGLDAPIAYHLVK